MSWPATPIRTIAAAAWLLLACGAAQASDHLDTPSVIADPRADIGDLYAWTSPDGRRLNLVMTIVGQSFSDRIDYMFHVDSGRRFGETAATTTILCRFPAPDRADCRAGNADTARGDPSRPDGLQGRNRRFRVFAGRRDDPFFNNVKGTRAAYRTALAAIEKGAKTDAAGCPAFDRPTSAAILDQWRHSDGGPGRNFLAGWSPAAIVVSVDLDVVARGGSLLAVWAATVSPERQVDRAGRPLTGNALLGTLAPDEVSDRMKEAYNAATPAASARFAGHCGNQLLADPKAPPSERYARLATLLADDRLWINSASRTCTQLFAVELASLAGKQALSGDCGGRTPNYKSVTVYRSLLADATNGSIDDGVDRDEREHSAALFPFLAEPAPQTETKR